MNEIGLKSQNGKKGRLKSKKICILFDLPLDVYHFILSEWFNMKTIGKLDCAISQTDIRQLWLDQLQSKFMGETLRLYNNYLLMKRYKNFCRYYHWLWERKICTTILFVNGSCLDSTGNLQIIINLSNILTIYTMNCFGTAFQKIINNCDNLTTLYDFEDNEVAGVESRVMGNITCLQLPRCSTSLTSLDHIVAHCKSLQTLAIPYNSHLYTKGLDIIKTNQYLVEVELEGDLITLEALFIHCISIQHVTIHCHRGSTLGFDNINKDEVLKWTSLNTFSYYNSGSHIQWKSCPSYLSLSLLSDDKDFLTFLEANIEGLSDICLRIKQMHPELNKLIDNSSDRLERISIDIAPLPSDILSSITKCKHLKYLCIQSTTFEPIGQPYWDFLHDLFVAELNWNHLMELKVRISVHNMEESQLQNMEEYSNVIIPKFDIRIQTFSDVYSLINGMWIKNKPVSHINDSQY